MNFSSDGRFLEATATRLLNEHHEHDALDQRYTSARDIMDIGVRISSACSSDRYAWWRRGGPAEDLHQSCIMCMHSDPMVEARRSWRVQKSARDQTRVTFIMFMTGKHGKRTQCGYCTVRGWFCNRRGKEPQKQLELKFESETFQQSPSSVVAGRHPAWKVFTPCQLTLDRYTCFQATWPRLNFLSRTKKKLSPKQEKEKYFSLLTYT